MLLEKAISYTAPIPMEPMTENEKIMARGIASALKALIGGKALTSVRHLPERMNGFEMWRILAREYRPDTATRKLGMLERVMEDAPRSGEDFGDWVHRWMDLVGETEKARGRPIDDDIKVAVILKRAPKELRSFGVGVCSDGRHYEQVPQAEGVGIELVPHPKGIG